jgi:hypothetical protein
MLQFARAFGDVSRRVDDSHVAADPDQFDLAATDPVEMGAWRSRTRALASAGGLEPVHAT